MGVWRARLLVVVVTVVPPRDEAEVAHRGEGCGTGADGDWPVALAHAAAAAGLAGRGTVVVVPDRRDLSRLDRAMREVLGPGRHVRLDADQGPQARYTAWLKALRGHVRVAIGTRAAAFAPVRDLGLVAWWDDGDDLHDEPRAPYPHVRDILLARAGIEGAAVLSAGFVRTAAVQRLVADDRLRRIEADRASVRAAAPRVHVAGEDRDKERDPAAASAHLPTSAWKAARAGLEQGPVLVQVPRRGYVPALSCAECRAPARCAHCHGPLGLAGAGERPRCRWCDREAGGFRCTECEGTRTRAATVGARRTAEEIGRAFRGAPVHTSGAGHVLDEVADAPSLVIATPGAEPVARGGYAAALLLDAWALLDRPTLDAGEETLRRWVAAAALVRPGGDGGVVVLAGVPDHSTLPAVEALVRWDPAWFAERELADRRGLRLPPYAAVASLSGPAAQVRSGLDVLDRPADALVLGPTADRPDSPDRRAVVLVDDAHRAALAASVRALRARRSADKAPAGLQLRMDPRDPST
jgi:primosomal protein N' (replication factor Y)